MGRWRAAAASPRPRDRGYRSGPVRSCGAPVGTKAAADAAQRCKPLFATVRPTRGGRRRYGARGWEREVTSEPPPLLFALANDGIFSVVLPSFNTSIATFGGADTKPTSSRWAQALMLAAKRKNRKRRIGGRRGSGVKESFGDICVGAVCGVLLCEGIYSSTMAGYTVSSGFWRQSPFYR